MPPSIGKPTAAEALHLAGKRPKHPCDPTHCWEESVVTVSPWEAPDPQAAVGR